MKNGDRIYVRGYVDEIRKDTVIVRNDGGYFGTILSEVTGELPSAQPETHDKRTEMHACDCVSRQAVQEIVDRIGGMYPYRQIGNRDSYSQYNEAWTDAINRVGAELNSLPSAQSTMGQQNGGDTISRRMAIDAMANTLWHYPNECYRNLNEYEFAKSLAELGLKSVPSVQPDDDRLERCKFEYLNACKIVAHPTKDTSKSDMYDAHAVIKALHPIFGDVEF